eukprot:CAMPEP_0116142788 /NCGR_PEP_ID=MMETSP0329-20121206/15096_1 /TAXON_ID=697910 /ORGANISM="Pseudo-nitzschia arenysensis, Strain B593" /LENGTH=526 /DNA_ID=CAMNT_0003638049 /DNA_START=47 /DNA_END=1627 /DNA_ORIENTATION=+
MVSEPLLPDTPSDFSVDNCLSEELLKLSFKERQAIQEEIHGVGCGAITETPKLIKDSLEEFDEKVNALKEQSDERVELDNRNIKKLLRNVCRTNSFSNDASNKAKVGCYLNDGDVRLRFLRCEMFDVDKAVERFICFLDFCSDIFGDYICEREMFLSDFNSQEVTILRNSRAQMLPFRDRSGRRVMVSVGDLNLHLPLKIRWKICMYFYWQSSSDIVSQRRGIVIALWPFDEDGGGEHWKKSIKPGFKESSEYQQKNNAGMPVRVSSLQMYYKDTPFFHALSALYVFYGSTPERRAVYRAHYGEHTELLYKFGSYGISSDLLPVSFTGTLKFGHMTGWINYQRAYEEKIKRGGDGDMEWIECPWPNDVIFRKGSTFRNNRGNVIYRLMVERFSEEHVRSNKKQKFEITHTIIDEIEKCNGRFLEWSLEKQLWLVIKDRDRVRRKIAAAFKYSARTRKMGSFEVLKGDTNYKTTKILGDESFKQARKFENRKDFMFMERYSEQHANGLCEEGSCFGKSFHSTEANSN